MSIRPSRKVFWAFQEGVDKRKDDIMTTKVSFIPTGTVEVPEFPFQDEVHLPPDKSAVIVVDMQNDFVSPGGYHHRHGRPCEPMQLQAGMRRPAKPYST